MMNPFQTLGMVADAATWEAVGWFVAKLTAIAGLGHLVLHLMPRASAATRHVVAIAALAAIVAVPVATALLPGWALPVLPASTRVKPLSMPNDAVAAIVTPRDDAASPVVFSETEPTSSAAPAASLSSAGYTGRSVRREGASPFQVPPSRLPEGPAVVLFAVGLVAASLVVRAALACLASWLLVRRAEPVRDEAIRRELDLACGRLGVRSPVEVRISPRVVVPMVCGFVRPVLLLPAQALDWSPERRRSVFLHELAHVLRGDAWSLVLSRVATALFWFHPFVLTLDRVARRECERACDDIVLGSGVRPSDYADHLLEIARSTTARPAFGDMTLAMATRSSLEGRLLVILSPDVRRGSPSKRAVAMAAVASLLLLGSVASVRVVAAPFEPMATQDASENNQDDPLAVVDCGDESRAVDGPAAPAACDACEHGVSDACDEAAEMPEPPMSAEAPEPPVPPVPPVPPMPPTEARVALLSNADIMMELAGSRSGEQWFDRARELYSAEQYGAAGIFYENAGKSGHRPDIAFYNAACSFALAGRKTRALGALRNALNAGFDDPHLIQSDTDLNSIRSDTRFRLLLDDVLSSGRGDSDRKTARWTYDALRSSGSTDANAWSSVGIALMRAGDTDGAVDAFKRQIRIDGSSTGTYNLACAHALGGDTEAALDALERSLDAGYGDSKKLMSDPDLMSLHGNPQFERLVRMGDDLSLFQRNDDDDRRSVWRAQLPRFERGVQRYPKSGRAWFNLGYAQLKARDAEGSLESFTQALELGYRRPTTMYNLACSAAQLNDRDAAFRWLERAEEAGMELGNHVLGDDDLDPIRSDARFRVIENRIRRGWRSDKAKHDHKSS